MVIDSREKGGLILIFDRLFLKCGYVSLFDRVLNHILFFT
jgi:hypothetical protein